ncbi:mutagen-sensitive 101 isoform X1 [Leptinotarsa decemlineata]|uniref:mutagen-sensitive 101 isoform X1 n=1 Tax=Leptinotarsa decemlineata TaxID=7539 RepID=UPI003D3091F6
MENIRIIFVLQEKLTDESEASEIMQQAFEACKQNISTNVDWMKESEFDFSTLNKTDFVVFDEFVGKCFEELKTTKCARILGPWAVSVCLMEGKSIPNFPWPIYNVAMYDCIVTSSHLSKNIKMEIKTKVELMGGCYVDTLVAKNTHLVTGSAKSEKYLAAAEAGVKLMCPSWIDDVWKVSQSVNAHADDDQFKKHTCLPFQNLTICSTGLTKAAERQKIEMLIKKNGGIFSGKLNLTNTDILICCGEGLTISEKYKAARQYPHIKCVNLSWVTDSVAKGYALPHNQYQIQKVTSTPTKSDEPVNPEFSVLSAIGGPNMSQRAWVEETLASPFSPGNDKVPSVKRKVKEDFEELVDSLDIKKAKNAGQYLDGCTVYVTGFSTEHTEKLNKVLNLSGANRYDSFSERVTHVIVGDPTFHEVKVIQSKGLSSILVSVRWLIDSIEQTHPMNEDKYLINRSDFENSHLGSPLSKKGLSMLRTNRTVTQRDVKNNLGNFNNTEDKMEDDIVRQYMKQTNTNSEEDTLVKLLGNVDNSNFSKQVQEPPKSTLQFNPPDTSTQQSTMSVTQDLETEISKIFENFKFLVIGFEEEEFAELKSNIEGFYGELVPKNYKGIPDFIVVPVFNKEEIHHNATEIVNDLFITECIREETLLPDILYYHRPFDVPDTNPLVNCVITISSYSGAERVFLKNLIEALGGVAQEQFARVRSEAKGVLASTHLVSAEATGKKYEAALKWGLPVLSKEWLLDCAKTERLVYEADYLLGTSKAPERKPSSPPVVETLHTSVEDVAKNTTPSTSRPSSRISRVLTPVNHLTPAYKRFLDSAEKPFSQVTPVNKIMKHFRESNLNSSLPKEKKEYTLPQPWMAIKTPETPLGACMTPNPSPGLRKQCEYWLQQFPDKESPKSNVSTPLSEIKRQLWSKVLKKSGQSLDFDHSQGEQQLEENMDSEELAQKCPSQGVDKTPENPQLASRLQQLEEMLSASGGGRRQSRTFHSTVPVPARSIEFKDSQPCTVGWDFTEQEEPRKQIRKFAISGVADDVKANIVKQLENLGAQVSNLTNYDPTCTHLLCPKPARNEKSLSCMAAGKWVVHTSYLEKCVQAGHFLDEEEFEFGNPKAEGKFGTPQDRESELRIQRMHWWRKEISRRGYGAFNDMRAIVVANKRNPIMRVIEAGGGVVIDVKPPFDDTVHATHCLLELKSVENVADYIPLARQGIYLVNTVYISDYLHQPNRDIRDCVLPYFSKFYARS